MAKENLEIRKLENTNIAIAINNVGNSASTLLTVEEVESLIKELTILIAPPLVAKSK